MKVVVISDPHLTVSFIIILAKVSFFKIRHYYRMLVTPGMPTFSTSYYFLHLSFQGDLTATFFGYSAESGMRCWSMEVGCIAAVQTASRSSLGDH